MAEFNKVLEKVRGLIAKADHANTSPEEADAYRQKADSMMLEYAITEAALDATRPAEQRVRPEKLVIDICESASIFARYHVSLINLLADHCRCTIIFHNAYGTYGRTSVSAVGFPSDLRYLELMYTAVYLHMSGEIEPKPDPAKSFGENCYILHAAGISWRRIVFLTIPMAHDFLDVEVRNAGGRCKTAYRRHCAEIGEQPVRINSPVSYQRNFCEAYVHRIRHRLWDMRQKQDGIGTALVLRQEDVQKTFEEMFPPEESMPIKAAKQTYRYDAAAQEAGRKSGDRARLTADKEATGGNRKAL